MRIERKKLEGIITLIIALFGLLMFFTTSIFALFMDMPISEKLIFLLFFIISSFGLYTARTPLIKIFSSNPEFELSDNELRIFDNPYFDRIPYQEMLECDIYHPPRTTLIGITLKPTSEIQSNSNKFQRLVLSVPNEKSKIVFFSLDFAKINPEDFKLTLTNKIEEQNKKSA